LSVNDPEPTAAVAAPVTVEPDAAEEAPRASRRRRVAVWVLIALAALIALVSSLTIWVREQMLDTEAWVDSSAELLENDEIRSALAVSLSDFLIERANVQARLETRLPDQLDPLAGVIAGAVETRAPAAAEQLLASPRVLALWTEINRRMHTRLTTLLEEGEGGTVVLDLQPLVLRLADRLGVEVQLEPGAAQITILQSDQLEAAQTAVRALKVLTVFLGLVVVALVALAVYLAKGFRREALRAAGVSFVVVGLILLVVRRVLGNKIIEALTSAQTEPAGSAAWLIATDLLKNLAVALLAYGIVLFLAAWIAGPSRFAVRIRRALAPTFERRPGLVFAGVALALLLALYFGPAGDTRRLFGILVLCALVMLGVEALRRQTLREFGTAESEAPSAAPPPSAPPPAAPPAAPA
jgi:hypothetical protein